ncbi:MAG: MinD/ParA family protein [Candidatus Rokubacteria bacterium]|nr:MinD/ParA family protein [Candidatus Rokubacteria bacterium]
MDDQAGRLRARMSGRQPRVVTITSGKGGVGKTTVVANLGLEIARLGRRVLMLDGDFGLANLAILFNLAPKKTLEDAIAGRCRLNEILLQAGENLSLIPAASGAAQLAEMAPTERAGVLRAIGELGSGVDVMLIDTGAGIGSTVQALVAMADRALLVTTHEPTALSDAYGLIKSIRRRATGGPRLDVIVNMAASHVQARETHARLARLTERFLGFVPELAAVIVRDDAVGEAIVKQQPLTRIYPYAHATRAIASLARVLVDPRGSDHATANDSTLAVSDRR